MSDSDREAQARSRVARDTAEYVLPGPGEMGEARLALARARERMRWQSSALEAAVDGAPLATSLDQLARMVIAETAGEARTAFYMADSDGSCSDREGEQGTAP